MPVPAEIPRLSACLFCGSAPATDETAEDVFPKWLQREFSLGNQTLTLLNGSTVRYSQLTVPACQPCNNNHASQLEQRISSGSASDQDLWLWLLKLQLGTLFWESARPMAQDRRHPLAALPIVDNAGLDITFLHAVFQALRHPKGYYVPNPMGSVFRLPAPDDKFDYVDKIYAHPLRPDSMEYSAAYVQLHCEAWIVLFDDMGQVARETDGAALERIVRQGRHPLQVFAELMFQRARHHYMPRCVVAGAPGAAQAVTFVPPMGWVEILEAREDDLARFYEACGFSPR